VSLKNYQQAPLGLATVGLVAIKKEVVKSLEFLKGKKGDIEAANQIVQQIWSNKKTIQLSEHITDDSIILTVPSSTKENVIPIQLAKFLSQETKTPWLNGDSIFDTTHDIASKNIARDKRVFNKRKYSISKNKNLSELQNKKIFIADDIITSGSSIRNYSEFLRDNNLKVSHVIALMGDRRLDIDLKTEEKLKLLLKDKNIGIKFESIRYITRTEAGGLIRLLNNARSDNAIRKLTQNIHGIQRHRTTTNIKEYSRTARHQSTGKKDKGNVGVSERIQTYSRSPGIEWKLRFIRDGITLRSEKIILPKHLSRKEQLSELQKKARQITKKNNLGLVQIKIQLTGKSVLFTKTKCTKQELGR
jgi:hypothetical protein